MKIGKLISQSGKIAALTVVIGGVASLAFLAVTSPAEGQTGAVTKSLTLDTNGVVTKPANFWVTNAAGITNVVGANYAPIAHVAATNAHSGVLAALDRTGANAGKLPISAVSLLVMAGTSQYLPIWDMSAGTWGVPKAVEDFSPSAGSTNITTVGTVTNGTWAATPVAITHGGTGASSTNAFGTAIQSGISSQAGTPPAGDAQLAAWNTTFGFWRWITASAAGVDILTATNAAAQANLLPVGSATQTALDLKANVREIKTANFTAAVAGRYTVNGTVTVTDPSGTVAGQIYSVLCGSGTATIGGTAYSPSRLEIVRYYNGSSWSTLSPTISDEVQLKGGAYIAPTKVITYEGATDDANETTLAVADPTADRTITFPDESGTVLTSGSLYFVRNSSDENFTGTSMANSSLAVTLPAGTFSLNAVLCFTTASTTAGISSQFRLTNSGDSAVTNGINAQSNSGTVSIKAAQGGVPINVISYSDDPNMSGQVKYMQTQAVMVLAAQRTIYLEVAQRSATDNTNPAILKAGSWILIRKLQ